MDTSTIGNKMKELSETEFLEKYNDHSYICFQHVRSKTLTKDLHIVPYEGYDFNFFIQFENWTSDKIVYGRHASTFIVVMGFIIHSTMYQQKSAPEYPDSKFYLHETVADFSEYFNKEQEICDALTEEYFYGLL